MLNWLWPWSQSPSDTSSSPMTSSAESPYLPPPAAAQTATTSTSTSTLDLDLSSPAHEQSHSQPSQQPRQGLIPLDNNKKLVLGGAAFMTLSIILTRRAFQRRLISTIPGYYTSSTYHKPKVNAAMDALEGLYLATLNVASFGMFASGAALWKLGVNDLEGLRSITRRAIASSASGSEDGKTKEDEQIEEEVQEWLAKTFIGRYKDEVDREVERRVKERREREESGK